MLLELGPVPADEVRDWTRFARRMITELRVDPGDLAGIACPDSLDAWAGFIDEWDAEAAKGGREFRWSNDDLDTELACYLLHFLERSVHSDDVARRLGPDDMASNHDFTLVLVQAFVDGLAAVGTCEHHLVDQIKTAFASELDH